MSGRDAWIEKHLAREARGKAKVAAIAAEAEVLQLVQALNEKGASHADVARRWGAASEFEDSFAASLAAMAYFTVARELHGAFTGGRPITLKARLETAKEKLSDNYTEKRFNEWLKKLARKEKAREKRATK